MPKNRIITGLDIGTDSLKIVSCFRGSNSSLEVLAQARTQVFGMRRGVVVNADEVSKGIRRAVSQIENLSNHKIEEVYVNVGGSHLYLTPSRGTVVVSRADQKISEEDIGRAIQAAQTFPVPSNKEILNVFPKEFIVDGQGGIKEPRDMRGIRLEAEILALCVFSPYLKNLTSAILSSGIQISDIIPSPLASAKSCLTPQQKELGVALLDIGAGTTGLAVYEEGDLVHLAVFPIGSAHITNDIAVGLQIDIDVAEQIKRKFGSCLLDNGSYAKKNEKIEMPQEGSSLVFSRKMLVNIIEARISEIFDLAEKEIKKVSPRNLLPAGLVLTGGGAKLPKIVELAKKELKLPARIGFPQGFLGLEEDPSLSSVCGLVLEGFDSEAQWYYSGFGDTLGSKVKKIFKIFIP
jgi:cell division protein FtsA